MRIKLLELETKHYACEKCGQLTDIILNIDNIYLCIDCLKKGVNLTLEIEQK